MSLRSRVKRLEHATFGDPYIKEVVKRMWLRGEIHMQRVNKRLAKELAELERERAEEKGLQAADEHARCTFSPGPLSDDAQQLLQVDTEEQRRSDQRAWERHAKANGITSPRGVDGYLIISAAQEGTASSLWSGTTRPKAGGCIGWSYRRGFGVPVTSMG